MAFLSMYSNSKATTTLKTLNKILISTNEHKVGQVQLGSQLHTDTHQRQEW
jgi:hypothetical protein